MTALSTFLIGSAACLVGLVSYPYVILLLSRAHLRQRVHSYSPATHERKAGTPTMGGVLFLGLAGIAFLLFARGGDGIGD